MMLCSTSVAADSSSGLIFMGLPFVCKLENSQFRTTGNPARTAKEVA